MLDWCQEITGWRHLTPERERKCCTESWKQVPRRRTDSPHWQHGEISPPWRYQCPQGSRQWCPSPGPDLAWKEGRWRLTLQTSSGHCCGGAGEQVCADFFHVYYCLGFCMPNTVFVSAKYWVLHLGDRCDIAVRTVGMSTRNLFSRQWNKWKQWWSETLKHGLLSMCLLVRWNKQGLSVMYESNWSCAWVGSEAYS